MKIKNFDLNKKILIVAEIGNNHEGSLTLAKMMIKLAKKSGANAVKFQTFNTSEYVSEIIDPQRFEMLNKFEFKFNQFKYLKEYANKLGLIFISTPFDINSARNLSSIVDAFKVSSSDLNFYKLINVICEYKKPIILSTGLAGLSEIKKTLNYIRKYRPLDKVVLLHCVSKYPTPHNEANLNNILSLKKLVNIFGYSDHTIGIDAPLCSIPLGVRIIEKHFTIDNNYSNFRDHKIALNPDDFSIMVNKIRNYEELLNNKNFKPSNVKKPYLYKRSIALNKNLPKNSVISNNDITWVRPGIGHIPGNEKKFLGKKINKYLKKGTILKLKYLL